MFNRNSNLRRWLEVSQEEHSEDSPVITQHGDTPKQDFSDATNEDTGDVDTAKPAAAEIPPASEGDDEGKTIDQGHQTVHVSAEEAGEGKTTVEGEVSHDGGEVAKANLDEEGSTEPEATPETSDSQVSPKEHETPEEPKPEGSDTDRTAAADTPDKPASDVERTTAAEEGKPANEEHGDGESAVVSESPAADGEVTEGEVGEQPAEGVVVDAPVVEDEVDAGQAAEVDVDDVEADIDYFERTSQALEAYHTLLKDSLDADGIDGRTAQAIRIGLEALGEDFGSDKVLPSVEAFGQIASTRTATRLGIESLQEKLSQVQTALGNAREYRKRFDAVAAEDQQ